VSAASSRTSRRGAPPETGDRSAAHAPRRSPATVLARALGVCCGPLVVPVPLIALAAAYGAEPLAWRDAALFVLFLTVMPASLVLATRRLGWVRDLDVSDREERAPVVAAAAVLAAAGAIVLQVDGAQPTLASLAGAATAQGTLLALLTLGDKVSYHAVGALDPAAPRAAEHRRRDDLASDLRADGRDPARGLALVPGAGRHTTDAVVGLDARACATAVTRPLTDANRPVTWSGDALARTRHAPRRRPQPWR
jgi:hypothetical protein